MRVDYDIAIIGAGLAGLSAALTCARLGRRTVVFTDGVPGGELVKIERIDGVPGYEDGVAGYDLCPITQEQAEALGVEFVMEPAGRITPNGSSWSISSGAGDTSCGGVIIASGARLAELGIPGEDRLRGHGVSDCASCDGPLLRGKTAVVAGGGDSAMQEALVLAGFLEKVVMLVKGDGLTGQAPYREAVLSSPVIEIRLTCEPVEILGDEAVSHVRIRDLASGTEDDLATDAVFAFVGLVPNTRIVAGVTDLDDTGRIDVDAAMRATVPGLCAAGNVRCGSPHRAAGAMGDGAAAAASIDAYLQTGTWRTN